LRKPPFSETLKADGDNFNKSLGQFHISPLKKREQGVIERSAPDVSPGRRWGSVYAVKRPERKKGGWLRESPVGKSLKGFLVRPGCIRHNAGL
jgi:hypothetical protein